MVRTTERILNNFHKKVEALRKAGADMDDFEPFEVSGIAGTQMEDTLSFDVARWLVNRMPGQVEIAWDNYEPGRELGQHRPALHAPARRRCMRRGRHAVAPMAGDGAAGEKRHDKRDSGVA